MTRIPTLALAAALLLAVGCQGGSPAAILMQPCATGKVDHSGNDPGVPTPGPFSYALSTEPGKGETAEQDAAELNGGGTFWFTRDQLLLAFDAELASVEVPGGKPTGILAHRELIEPVLRDFDLELVEQSVMSMAVPSPAPSEAPSRVTAMPMFLVRVRNAEAVPLGNLQGDAVAAGFGDAWTFHRAGALGTFARAVQLTRAMPCYRLRSVGLNIMMMPL